MKISIIGLGWFGAKLAEALKAQHEIFGTSRSEEKVKAFSQVGITAEVLVYPHRLSKDLLNADVIVVNIPPFKEQLDWFQSWDWNKKSHVIFISSTSVYGEMEGEVDEETVPQPETENARLLLQEEKWFKTFPLYTIVRFGGLIGENRHPGKYLSGRKDLAGGNQFVNLIHQDDCVAFTKLLIDKKIIQETFNLVSPAHLTREEYYTSYCLAYHLPTPQFVPSSSQGKIISSAKALKFFPISSLV